MLCQFLEGSQTSWIMSLFHYRNHGGGKWGTRVQQSRGHSRIRNGMQPRIKEEALLASLFGTSNLTL